MTTRVKITTHKEYNSLDVHVDGEQVFYGHSHDFTHLDLVNLLKRLSGQQIEIEEAVSTAW